MVLEFGEKLDEMKTGGLDDRADDSQDQEEKVTDGSHDESDDWVAHQSADLVGGEG